MSSTHAEKHVVALAYQAWGHTRPLVQLSARLVKMRSLHVTFFTTNAFFDKVLVELARSFELGEEAYASRVRVISLGESVLLSGEAVDEGFRRACVKLVAGQELQCVKTGKVHAALPPPRAAIIDFFAVNPIAAIKEASKNSVKVYAWYSAMTTSAFTHIVSDEYGGPGNIRLKAEAVAKQTGKPFTEAVVDLLFVPKGRVLDIPGLPPLSDYEMAPQDFPMPVEVMAQLFPRLYETIEVCDGVFFISPASYEPEALETCKTWLRKTGRSGYVCGPLLPQPHGLAAESNEKKQSQQSAEIVELLDATLKTSGEKSLLYISFGSFFWPAKSPEKLWAFLDVVMELNIPFILSMASPLAGPLPDEISTKVKAYGKGLVSPWTPQQLILEHPATGWFVTHGGHNSVVESISAGVPMIAWPFNADQPLNALRISEVLKIGYELIEVRTGHGTHPLHRNGRKPVCTIEAVKAEAKAVLTRAFDEDGAKKRERVLALTRAFEQEWAEGGASWKDVNAFLDSI
ncbi:glycosyltransferase family 1 protein [Trametes coccinea BRFM310]|uniref:Glycosyltransferase family 1 protein n=1 Tax=Trametes coccinea (strain BRFM310) TaxID=1353009 RepID=A0A1Y2IS28_TRAC3|nr:glycosyltransferase family 1 protein [Trametes coccinea BRFM310]